MRRRTVTKPGAMHLDIRRCDRRRSRFVFWWCQMLRLLRGNRLLNKFVKSFNVGGELDCQGAIRANDVAKPVEPTLLENFWHGHDCHHEASWLRIEGPQRSPFHVVARLNRGRLAAIERGSIDHLDKVLGRRSRANNAFGAVSEVFRARLAVKIEARKIERGLRNVLLSPGRHKNPVVRRGAFGQGGVCRNGGRGELLGG